MTEGSVHKNIGWKLNQAWERVNMPTGKRNTNIWINFRLKSILDCGLIFWWYYNMCKEVKSANLPWLSYWCIKITYDSKDKITFSIIIISLSFFLLFNLIVSYSFFFSLTYSLFPYFLLFLFPILFFSVLLLLYFLFSHFFFLLVYHHSFLTFSSVSYLLSPSLNCKSFFIISLFILLLFYRSLFFPFTSPYFSPLRPPITYSFAIIIFLLLLPSSLSGFFLLSSVLILFLFPFLLSLNSGFFLSSFFHFILFFLCYALFHCPLFFRFSLFLYTFGISFSDFPFFFPVSHRSRFLTVYYFVSLSLPFSFSISST